MTSSNAAPRHVMLTGPPGMGKTAVVKKVVELLQKEELPIQGFYTEEVQDSSGKRIGFDCVSVNDPQEREPLARVKDLFSSKHKVGDFNVDVPNFEKLAFPCLSREKGQVMPIWIVDEIGKMEMFSELFTATVLNLVNDTSTTMLAVLPVPRGRPTPLMDEIRQRKDVKSIWVSKLNRDQIVKEVTDMIAESYDKYSSTAGD